MFMALSLGHLGSSCKQVSIAGLELKVFGLEEIKDSSLPIACVVSVTNDLGGTRSSQKLNCVSLADRSARSVS